MKISANVDLTVISQFNNFASVTLVAPFVLMIAAFDSSFSTMCGLAEERRDRY
jgi:hypothetical protein